MEKMTRLEKFMAVLEKHALKFVIAANLYSVFCIGVGTALAIEYGICLDFALLIGLSAILLLCTAIKLKEDIKDSEEE